MTREKSKKCLIAGCSGSLQKVIKFSRLKLIRKWLAESMLLSIWFGTLRLHKTSLIGFKDGKYSSNGFLKIYLFLILNKRIGEFFTN